MRLLNQQAMLDVLLLFHREFKRLYWSIVSEKGLGSNDQLLPLAEYKLIPCLVWAKRKYLVIHGIRGAGEMPEYVEIVDESSDPALKDVNTTEELISVLQLPKILMLRELPDVPETELHSLLQNREFIRSMAESAADEHIAALHPTIDQQARTMTTQYDALFKFENRLRTLIQHELKQAYGDGWWQKGVPRKTRGNVARRIGKSGYDWHQIETESLLHECDFRDLHGIVTSQTNWGSLFERIFSDKERTHWAFEVLESNRNPIAHSNLLPEERIQEFQSVIRRIERLIQAHLP